jgi:hypothetical protein
VVVVCLGGSTAWVDFPDEKDEDGVLWVLFFARFALSDTTFEPIAPRAEMALDEPFRERLVAMPLTSLSVSFVGSRLTNSLCSN